MSDRVLLILGIPDSDEEGLAIRKIQGRLDVQKVGRTISRDENVADQAFLYASRLSKSMVAIQIMTSELYHWGHNDIILPGPAKAKFIGHVREAIFNTSLETTKMLENKALRYGVELEILRIETDDPISPVIEEAIKGYDRIFIGREKKRIFPIFKRSIESQIRTKTSIPVISC